MRKVLAINNNWYFKSSFDEKEVDLSKLNLDFECVNLPHTNVELPYNYFDEKLFQNKSLYQYKVQISDEYKDKLVYIHFEGVMAYAEVFLNGNFIGAHKGGYTPFDVRIDKIYDFAEEYNILSVVVDSTERSDIPPFGGKIDYLTYGGIYREVSLNIYDKLHISSIKVETNKILEEKKGVLLKVFLNNPFEINGKGFFYISIKEKGGKEVYTSKTGVEIDSIVKEVNFEINDLSNIKLWDIDDPNLYEISVTLEVEGYCDKYTDTFGFRKAEFKPEGFYLNGRRLKLMGLNRHQSYPYVGYAMPRRAQEKDAEILKKDLHLNMVRTSHYPQSKHFLNKCDELGLLVFEEIPGWQHIGNEAWKEVAKENVREMVKRDWNHPSIILWGVRINESQDDDAFYTDNNKIAHELDASRQTGGVRYITNSNLLEDVYTFNDFIQDGVNKPLRTQDEVTGLSYKVPYLVTEYNGHMYPTKRFDQEERQMEHSLRHIKILEASHRDEYLSGTIGWCAFDYNTHMDFGAGDRICYHGIMDMFRLHKFAAYAYKSQVSPEVEPVLMPVTFWARGERSIGGIIPLVIFTNCDYIEFKFGDLTTKKIYPDRENFKAVPYAPIIIDFSVIKPEEAGSWGMSWENAEIEGYYKDKKVIEKRLSKNPVPSKLEIAADDLILSSAEKDATRIVVKVLDQCDNLLPFLDDIIKIEITGPAKIQGPSELVLKGGAIAFWIETLNEPGDINLKVTSRALGSQNITISVI